ncbi:MAG TPA: sugar transferase [Acidimicrobiales bacterium]|nr:sugar transferase [Acidimicrobiales bacterium]
MSVSASPQCGWRLAVKRCSDRAAAAVLLVVLGPLIGASALLVRARMGRPVLFTQERLGWHGQPFRIVKFRTMDGRTDGRGNPLPDAARLTALGRLMRSWSLDELPELVNVLRGEVSLVGPRPLLPEYAAVYTEEQNRRHDVLPGITGWAQVNGRNALTWEQRLALDVWYVDHWSLVLDADILLRTVLGVVRRDGIAFSGHATSPRFDEVGRPQESAS